MHAKADPELLAQLHDAGQGLVQAVLHLQSPTSPGAPLTGAETQQLSESLLHRVATAVGEAAARSNVLRNVQTLIVEAAPQFVKTLLEQPEVAAAYANRKAESPMIPPKGKRPVE